MNMGVLILLSIAAIACVNVLAVRYNRKWDLTTSHLFSLSDQSEKAVDGLQGATDFTLLYRGGEQSVDALTREIREVANLYTARSNKIKYSAYDVLKRPDLAKKFEFTAGPFAVFVSQGERHLRVDAPSEEGFTRALLKLSHNASKTLYLVTGHGEFNPDGTDPDGLSQMKSDLAVTYNVQPLKLFEVGNKVPSDAATVAILRPQTQFTEAEIQGLRDYVRRGGSLLLALDPGFRHNLALLAMSYGIEFQNNFVIDQRSKFLNSAPVTVIGSSFPDRSEITKAFQTGGGFALFHIASNLKKAIDASPAIHIETLVETDTQTGAVAELSERIEMRPNGPHAIGMVATGPASASPSNSAAPVSAGEPAPQKEFHVVVFGDSDFISNRLVHNNLNADLFLNSISFLMSDKDLISIRPKAPEGTKLVMTAQSFNLLFVLFILPLPILLFSAGGFVWWRRKTA